MAFIYVLHLDEPISHAQHYSGCTNSLRKRMERHASGAGGNLLRVAAERGIGFTLATVSLCSHSQMRRIERLLKDRANGPRYCAICTPDPCRLPNTTPVDTANFRFPLHSSHLTKIVNDNVTLTIADEYEPKETFEAMIRLMQEEREALGWLPVKQGGQEGVNTLMRSGQIVLAKQGNSLMGYTSFTVNPARTLVTINQCVVEDSFRFSGYGTRMVREIQDMFGEMHMKAVVKDTLAANHFWRAIGYEQIEQKRHKTSGNLLNVYHHKPMILPNMEFLSIDLGD